MKDTELKIEKVEDLEALAAKVASQLKGGEIVGLVGDLGAGKTTFVRALAGEMGITKDVRSPTFILMQCFDVGDDFRNRTGISELCHIDAYRLKSEDELFTIGFGEYAEREDAVTVVEWADQVESISWLEDYRQIKFAFSEVNGSDGRVIICDRRLLPDE